MSQKFQIKQHVRWNFGNGTAKGQITESFKEKVTKNLQGAEVTRNATKECPAYLIEQDDGAEVLKSETELEAC